MGSKAWDRGWTAAVQDACENCPFASAGGMDRRQDMVAPDYIPEEDREDYLDGYRAFARATWGEDWVTCRFGWKPVMTIGPGGDVQFIGTEGPKDEARVVNTSEKARKVFGGEDD